MTFSIAARCRRTGMLGVATSSKALAAGGLVPYCRAGVGAIASQSFVNPYLGIDEALPERLIRTLEAGQDAGGDRRGRQSAGILVVGQEEYPWCDLRVDDHPDPVPDLRRVFDVYRREQVPFLSLMARRGDYTPG